MIKHITLALLLCAGSTSAAEVFNGKDGLVIMEAESVSSKGRWKKKTSVEGFTGECHLEFTGNQPSGGSPGSKLKYYFTVDKDGVYQLLIRAHKRLDGARHDLCNDCYVKLKGDFDTGGKVPLKVLKTDTKIYGGSDKEWGWTSQIDSNHKKYPPLYKLKVGKKYTFTISGRSQRFNIDRIIFKHESVSGEKAKDPKQTESPS